MQHRLARATLILLAAAPGAGAQAQQASPDPAPDELVRRAAEKLAAQGLSVDLEHLTIAVRPQAEREQAELARLEAQFGAARAGAYRLLLQGAGMRFVDGHALLADWARGLAEDRAVDYLAETGELVIAAEHAGELAQREGDLLAALAQAARHRAGAPAFEAPAPETLDGWLARRALASGAALAEARRALRDVVGQDLRRGHELDLPRLERELARRGLEAFGEASSPEARAAEWAAAWPSSEQLLHRDKRGKDVPAEVPLPPWPPELAGAELLHEDTIGELAISAVLLELGSSRPRAETAATGWDGDRLRHYRTAEGEEVLVWRTIWDRAADAQQFADEWGLHAKGQTTRRGGRGVDWVLADSRGVANKLFKALDASPQRVTPDEADAVTTEQAEQQSAERQRSAPYVVANEWRHPLLDLTVVVPVGWYEDERDGIPFMVRTKTAGYRDNVQVISGAPDAKTLDEILAINEQRLSSGDDHELLSAERRMIGPLEVGLLRYKSRQGAHGVVYSTLVMLRGWRQVAVTVAVEEGRWKELEDVVEWILTNVRLEPVEPQE
jgi:hypothetical protein